MIELVNRFGIIPGIKKKYLIDSPEELTELDTTFGNEAYCIGDTKTYICNGSGEYVEKKVSGGKKLYQHNIYIDTVGCGGAIAYHNITFSIFSKQMTELNYADIYSFLFNNGFNSDTKLYCICGWGGGSNNDSAHVIGLYASNNIIYICQKCLNDNGIPAIGSHKLISNARITDTIIEL
jgi:hypothetical protein